MIRGRPRNVWVGGSLEVLIDLQLWNICSNNDTLLAVSPGPQLIRMIDMANHIEENVVHVSEVVAVNW